jgi:hypothetical protein
MLLPIRFYAGQDTEGTAGYESSFDFDDTETNPEPDYVLSRTSHLSAEEEEKVEELIEEIRPEIPVYVAILKPSNVKSQYPSLVSCTILSGKLNWSNPVNTPFFGNQYVLFVVYLSFMTN